MTGGPRVTVVDLPDIDAGLRRAWAELADAAADPNPFFGPELLLAAAHRLPGGDAVRLFAVGDGDRLDLAVPLVPGRWRRVPAWTTWRHPHRFVGTPLVRPEALGWAPAALLRELAGRRGPALLALEQLYLDEPVAAAFRAAAGAGRGRWVEHDPWERPAVHARDDDGYLEAALGSRSRRTLRRQQRRLEEHCGPVRITDAARGAEPSDVAEAVDAFLALEAAGWKGRAGTALADDPRQAAFWREACAELAAAGRLEAWQLAAGDTLAAAQVHARQGGTVFHLKTAYDERLRAQSPGVQLEMAALHAFAEDPVLRLLDPCTDRGPTVSARLYPDTRRIGDALLGLRAAGRLSTALAPRAVDTWRAARARAGRLRGESSREPSAEPAIRPGG